MCCRFSQRDRHYRFPATTQRSVGRLLGLIIGDCRLDRIFRQHGAVDFDRRQGQFFHDVLGMFLGVHIDIWVKLCYHRSWVVQECLDESYTGNPGQLPLTGRYRIVDMLYAVAQGQAQRVQTGRLWR